MTKSDRAAIKRCKDALKNLKLPWHPVWSHDHINRYGKRRARRWAGCLGN